MLSSKQVGGQVLTSEPVRPGCAVQWVLANDGSVPWPQGTTLRLVGGPVLASPVMDVPSALPGQTLVIDLEILPEEKESMAEATYALVTPCGQPFGELLSLRVAGKQEVEAPPAPVCVVAVAPNDNAENGLEALQGELKTVEWTLANPGSVPWPEDVCCRLFYNTPGFAHLPAEVAVTKGVAPGMALQLGVTALMPETQGHFKAMWAVTSPSVPDFGEVLFVEFNVSDFPFMDWMLADVATADSISDSEVQEEEVSKKEPLSAAHVMHQHLVPGTALVTYDADDAADGIENLGRVADLAAGATWVLELTLTNNGTVAWPEDTALSCCFGSGLGCSQLALAGTVQPGEVVQLHVELEAPAEPCRCAWVLSAAGGSGCFGPAFVVEVL